MPGLFPCGAPLGLILAKSALSYERGNKDVGDKLTSLIQLTGLIIGIASFILIQFYVEHQKSYNTGFTDATDIYRINLIRGENKPQAQTPLRLATELRQNFNEIEDATRISPSSVSVKHLQGVYSERALYADANYLEFFDFQGYFL